MVIAGDLVHGIVDGRTRRVPSAPRYPFSQRSVGIKASGELTPFALEESAWICANTGMSDLGVRFHHRAWVLREFIQHGSEAPDQRTGSLIKACCMEAAGFSNWALDDL